MHTLQCPFRKQCILDILLVELLENYTCIEKCVKRSDGMANSVDLDLTVPCLVCLCHIRLTHLYKSNMLCIYSNLKYQFSDENCKTKILIT